MLKHFRSSDGLSLAFRDSGSGRPILCLPGLTRNSTDFDYLATSIRDVRLIRADYRGRGESDWDKNPGNYTPAIEARDAVELLDHLGIERVPVIGTSRGGIIAMVLAVSHRNRLAGVMLNDIGPELESAGLEKIFKYVGRKPDFISFDDAAKRLPDLMDGFNNVPEARWHGEVKRRYVSDPNGGLRINYDPRLRDAFIDSFKSGPPDLWHFFDALGGLPLGLIRGANSNLLSRETAEKMRKVRPDMEFAEALERGHCPFLDEPESLEAIERFLAKLDAQVSY